MANPIKQTLAQSITASASFTTFIPVLNYQLGSIQVVYSGMDTDVGVINIRGSNDQNPVAASKTWSQLNDTAVTLTSACDNKLFDITDIGYEYLQLQYKAVSNTTGQLSIYSTLKSYW